MKEDKLVKVNPIPDVTWYGYITDEFKDGYNVWSTHSHRTYYVSKDKVTFL
jgi:hypothetical protein